jgi:hypothetical protein
MRRNVLLWSVVLFVALGFTSLRSYAEIVKVWALDDGTKVKATATEHPLSSGNGIFDAQAGHISVLGARNETVAFQLIGVGGSSATKNVSVAFDKIGPIDNDGISSDPSRYFIGRNIEVFRQHYFSITTRSHNLSWESQAAMPADMLGEVPDALVPVSTGKAVDLAPARNQGFWVDIYIPKATPPGKYQSEIEFRVGGVVCDAPGCSMQVELEVLDATLPDTPSSKTMLWFSGSDNDRDQMMARYFQDPWGASQSSADAIRLRHYQLARRHRITLFLGDKRAPTDALGKRLSGDAFTKSAGYEGPGEGVGQDMYSILTYGGSLSAAESKVWSDFFATNAPNCEYFLYVRDEPSPSQYQEINEIASAIEPVPSFTTQAPTQSLSVDIFASYPAAYNIETAKSFTAAGKRVWIYNGVRPHTGSFATDDVAVSPRVNPLIQYKYEIPRWFYWESTYYQDFQGGRGNVDVFTDPINFTNSWGDEMNGDGLLFYPGRDFVFAGSDQGFDMPLPSIRLKNWRRGIQDVEYLVLAKSKGRSDLVDAYLAALVPKALNEVSSSQAVAWQEDGEKWLGERRKLAELFRSAVSADGGLPDGDAAVPNNDAGAGDGIMPPPSPPQDAGCGCATNGSPFKSLGDLGGGFLLMLLGCLALSRASRGCRGNERS